ncbi:hypothetical protein K505DRAFT_298770 [Melanomma pulvis-pyrius CBS 109.77]|uniref:Uncharacterized protein n=1 Tax=Melanomma pulvis-pyrius CBS 109.77 TaxID=1314802 RepID=A0A6A6XM26_9PLEO|nr:hypothetical protein K505DRAFT_298770 [Melanomma pulvis-pyrius CBS 109.77]
MLPFHAAAWKASSEPIQQLLDAASPQLQDEVTTMWRDTMQTHLNYIGVTSALVGSVVTSALSWPSLLKLSVSSLNTVTAIWYSALMLSLASIASSAQLAVALSRLSSRPDGLKKIRALLGKQTKNGAWKPRKLQLIIWQTPVSLLNTSVMMFTVGLSILVWKSVDWRKSWDDGAKVSSEFYFIRYLAHM